MKLFSAIMSIFILGLLFLPCDDIVAEDHEDVHVHHTDSSHEHETDACSPFCYCLCCQVISHPEFFVFYLPIPEDTETKVSESNKSEIFIYNYHWRPPEC